jgi:SSS family solute:Na+ symporter
MKAIMLTDFLQAVIILLGLACVVIKLLALVGFDVAAVWQFGAERGKTFGGVTDREFFSFDPHVRFSLWVWLFMSLLTPMTNYSTDQLVVQRILSTNSYASARRAILVKTAMTLPISMAFYFVGLLLYYYYHKVTGDPPKVEADQVLGVFINQHLPAPIPGLIVAAMLAALMSTISSTVGSLSTVTTIDLVQRFSREPLPHEQVLRLGKWLTVAGGVITLALSLGLVLASKISKGTTVLEVDKVANSLWGVLLVVVLAGIFTRWATARAAFVALLVGIAINATLPWIFYYGAAPEKRISFAWVGLPGIITAALIVVIGSLFDSRKQSNLAGLTWSTMPKPDPSNPPTTNSSPASA